MIQARSPFLGAKVANLSPALADELRLETSTEGVVVVDIDRRHAGAAASASSAATWCVSVNDTKIAKTRDLEKVAKAGARVWRVTIQRGGQQISAVFGG